VSLWLNVFIFKDFTMTKKTDSIKHTDETRAHIPSKEEAGYEAASPKVQAGKAALEIPKNPVTHRGQDPELFWLDKYGRDDRDELLKVDIRSLYRHEHVAPERIIDGLYKTVAAQANPAQNDMFGINDLFGNALEYDELDKISGYYQQDDGWMNRLIQGDSLLVMASLLEREGMAGQVQTIYLDPPYGIKYNSNWQMKLNDRNVKDGSDEHLSGEPEQIKAFRDTWELGIHSYLSYLRDRLLIARELLADSGSCFVQISDENVHLVRNVMDEVFGSENFVALIPFKKVSAMYSKDLASICDYLLWYTNNKDKFKFRPLFTIRTPEDETAKEYTYIELENGERRKLTKSELENRVLLPKNVKFFRPSPLTSQDATEKGTFTYEYAGRKYTAGTNRHWSTSKEGLDKLANLNRLYAREGSLAYIRYLDDFPAVPLANVWMDTSWGFAAQREKAYVVQTHARVVQRIILMTTDPGDLVLDPTCGSGTTAYVAEQWGRRWITIDTSRIALNIAKTRLMTAAFPYYKLHDETAGIRQGFQYKKVPHITLKSLANDEPPAEETLYDQPIEDKKRLRVAGPFTVETLQNYEPIAPESLDTRPADDNFEQRVFEHLKSAGVKNGIKNEQAVFIRVETLADSFLHAEGFYLDSTQQERKAYFHIGPKFGTVAKQAVNEAIKACRTRGDADWLIILGFSFESDISNQNVTLSLGSFEVTKVRMHDDLMQDGLMKKDKKAASFVTIGEPDVELVDGGEGLHKVKILGLDIYDPMRDQVKARSVQDIAYWMLDDDYDGNNFVVKQIFFCGGNKDEFKKWRKGLDTLAKDKTRRKAEMTLKIEIDEEAFDRLYGFASHPFAVKPGQLVAVRVVSQFGEESTKVLKTA
jgi:adenine-specific DNA-methyltransferase